MWLQRHAKFSQRIKISWCRIMTALTRTYSIYDCLLQYSVLLRFCITKEIWKIWVIPPPIVLSICKLLAWWCAYKIVRSAQRWSKWRSDVGRFFFFFRRAGRGGGPLIWIGRASEYGRQFGLPTPGLKKFCAQPPGYASEVMRQWFVHLLIYIHFTSLKNAAQGPNTQPLTLHKANGRKVPVWMQLQPRPNVFSSEVVLRKWTFNCKSTLALQWWQGKQEGMQAVIEVI